MNDVSGVVRSWDGIVLWDDAVEELMTRLNLDRSGAELLVFRAIREGEVQARLRGLPWRKKWTLEEEG